MEEFVLQTYMVHGSKAPVTVPEGTLDPTVSMEGQGQLKRPVVPLVRMEEFVPVVSATVPVGTGDPTASMEGVRAAVLALLQALELQALCFYLFSSASVP